MYNVADEVDLEDLLAALSPEEVSHLVDEMAADPDDKHMPASARSGAEEKLLKCLIPVLYCGLF